MPKTTVDSYGTWALPYLRPPDVPGASRCSLEFASQEIIDKKDFYRGKKRYRFNKWQPISPHFPRIHSSGLIFSADQEEEFSGVLTPWLTPALADGTVKLTFLPINVAEFDATTDIIEIGMGFSKYHAKYWGLAEGCEFLCKLTMSSAGLVRTYNTLRNTVTATRSFDPSKGTIFTLVSTATDLGIIYDEFDPDTSAVTGTELITIPNPGDEYRILFYIYTTSPKGSSSASVTLLSTDIDIPGLMLPTTEKVWFLENPSTFVPPIAPLRETGLSMYAKPYRALIEDGNIMVGSPYTPQIWMRTLDFLMTGSLEPAVFTDPDGYTWLVCFQSLNASSSMEVGDSGAGYELIMPIAVAH